MPDVDDRWLSSAADATPAPPPPIDADALPPPPSPGYAYAVPSLPPPAYGGAPASPTVYPGAPVVLVGQRTNALAVASLVLGIVWVFGIGSILAVIFGFVARRQIRQSGGHESGEGMALAGLILGFLGVLGLLLWIALFAVVGTTITGCHNEVGNLNHVTCTQFHTTVATSAPPIGATPAPGIPRAQVS